MSQTKESLTVRAKNPNRLKEIRVERGLTLEQASALSGFSLAAISRHENGNRGLDGSAIDRYARMYQVAPYELFVNPGNDAESA